MICSDLLCCCKINLLLCETDENNRCPLATSFPGSFVFPQEGMVEVFSLTTPSCGKMKDPWNEVGPLGGELNKYGK